MPTDKKPSLLEEVQEFNRRQGLSREQAPDENSQEKAEPWRARFRAALEKIGRFEWVDPFFKKKFFKARTREAAIVIFQAYREMYPEEAAKSELNDFLAASYVQVQQAKKGRKQKATPNRDERKIIDAINEGLKGKGFCFRLDEHDVKPRPGWEDKSSKLPWPGNYCTAYTQRQVEARKYWQKKIQDYKNDVQNKFPHLIHRKAKHKNSPTRQSE